MKETLILHSERYWANADREFTSSVDFHCSQKEQRCEPFPALAKKNILSQFPGKRKKLILSAWWTGTPLAVPLSFLLVLCGLFPYCSILPLWWIKICLSLTDLRAESQTVFLICKVWQIKCQVWEWIFVKLFIVHQEDESFVCPCLCVWLTWFH